MYLSMWTSIVLNVFVAVCDRIYLWNYWNKFDKPLMWISEMVSPYWLFMLVGFKNRHPTTKKGQEWSHIKIPDVNFKDHFHHTERRKSFGCTNGLFNRLLSRRRLGVSSSMSVITDRKGVMESIIWNDCQSAMYTVVIVNSYCVFLHFRC